MTYLVGCALLPHPPIMLAEVGGAESEKVKNTAAAAREAATFLMQDNPATVVIITPHGPAFRDAAGVNISPVLRGNLSAFNAAEIAVSFETNNQLAQNILKQADRLGVSLVAVDAAMAQTHRFSLQLDHGAVIPLHYLHQAGFRGQVVQLSVGFISYPEMYALGKAVQNAIEATKQKVAVLASGDLSHRLLPGAPAGYSPSGRVFDEKIISSLQEMDVKSLFEIDSQLVEEAGECGLRPIFFLLGSLDGLEAESCVLSYEGPFGVGYAVVTFKVKGRKTKEGKTVSETSMPVSLARESLQHFFASGRLMALPGEKMPPELARPAGAFVSLKKRGQLRGCIGTILPTQATAAQEIIRNAVSAATEDPRFPRVTAAELPELDVSVDILGVPEKIESMDALDPKLYGVIVRLGHRSGVLLPDLEGVDSVARQVEIACSKAGINPAERFELFRFQVVRYH